jgi:UDP-N-acetylmuramate dehydrogenase
VFKNPQGFSAGKLIEEAGCKGLRIGDIEVSTLHANFFINRGRGKATEFLDLMNMVIQKVQAQSDVLLEPEVKIVGRNGIDT